MSKQTSASKAKDLEKDRDDVGDLEEQIRGAGASKRVNTGENKPSVQKVATSTTKASSNDKQGKGIKDKKKLLKKDEEDDESDGDFDQDVANGEDSFDSDFNQPEEGQDDESEIDIEAYKKWKLEHPGESIGEISGEEEEEEDEDYGDEEFLEQVEDDDEEEEDYGSESDS